jgi:hypothetical protein
MTKYKFLYAEDQQKHIDTFEEHIESFNRKQNSEIIGFSAKTIEGAIGVLTNEKIFGVISDIDLKNEGDDNSDDKSGNDLIDYIAKSMRIPLAIYTSNLDKVDETSLVVKSLQFDRTKKTFSDVFDALIDYSKKDVFSVLGEGGTFDNILSEIYWHAINPNIDMWNKYKENNIEIDKVLSRLFASYISPLIEKNSDIKCFPEEVLLTPLQKSKIRFGGIHSKDEGYIIVLNPSCDLEQNKIEKVIFCLIDEFSDEDKNKIVKPDGNFTSKYVDNIDKIMRNGFDEQNLHSLPALNDFRGGRINFRKIESLTKSEFTDTYGDRIFQVSERFTNDIQSRFSSYLARQGQPLIDSSSTLDSFKI